MWSSGQPTIAILPANNVFTLPQALLASNASGYARGCKFKLPGVHRETLLERETKIPGKKKEKGQRGKQLGRREKRKKRERENAGEKKKKEKRDGWKRRWEERREKERKEGRGGEVRGCLIPVLWRQTEVSAS